MIVPVYDFYGFLLMFGMNKKTQDVMNGGKSRALSDLPG